MKGKSRTAWDYQRALDWIYSFVNLEVARTPHLAQDSMRLEKISHLLRALGDPQAGQTAVHIAGSKGKGSVAYMLAGWFTSRGLRTGLYTSPHIFDARERIQVDRQPIPEQALLELAGELRAIVERTADPALRPTFFDLFTAMAYAWFRRQDAGMWIVETGMGGRLDSTNTLRPALSIITSISREHTEILGHTLREISREKGGIIKPDTPVLVSRNLQRVVAELRSIAAERGAPLWYLPDHVRYGHAGYVRDAAGRLMQRVRIDGRVLETSLLGSYQAENIALFLLALRILASRTGTAAPVPAAIAAAEVAAAAPGTTAPGTTAPGTTAPGTTIPGTTIPGTTIPGATAPDAVDLGGFLRELDWPGRLTYRRLGSGPESAELLVDGAHNAESARALKDTVIRLRAAAAVADRPLVGIIGMFAEKDHAGILRPLLPLLRHVYFVEPDGYRDCRVEHYLPAFHRLNAALPQPVGHSVIGPVYNEPGWLDRLREDAARRFAGPLIFLGAGSLYTAAAILQALE